MKRNLTMLLAGLLVLVMASPLYAAPDIKVNGQIRTRFRYWVDLDLDSDIKGGGVDRRYFDNRTRLGVDAKLSDGVRAVIQLEKYFDFGNVGPSSLRSSTEVNTNAAPGTNDGNNATSTIGGTTQEPYIRQAWIDFVIPGLQEEGIRLQAGRSFFRLGHGYLWGNSLVGEDGFTLYGPLGPGNFKIRWAMTQNQSPARAGRARFGDNELTHWAVDYNFDVAEKQNVEIYFVGQRDRAVDGYTNLARKVGSVTPSATALDRVTHGDDFWVGAAYTGVAGPVALKAELIGQFGDTRKDVCFNPGVGPATVKAGKFQALSQTTAGTVTRGAVITGGGFGINVQGPPAPEVEGAVCGAVPDGPAGPVAEEELAVGPDPRRAGRELGEGGDEVVVFVVRRVIVTGGKGEGQPHIPGGDDLVGGLTIGEQGSFPSDVGRCGGGGTGA